MNCVSTHVSRNFNKYFFPFSFYANKHLHGILGCSEVHWCLTFPRKSGCWGRTWIHWAQEMFLCWSQQSGAGSLFPRQGWKMFTLPLSPAHTYFLFFTEGVICLYLTIHLSLWLQLMELSPLWTHAPFLNLSGLWPPKVTTASEVIWLSLFRQIYAGFLLQQVSHLV